MSAIAAPAVRLAIVTLPPVVDTSEVTIMSETEFTDPVVVMRAPPGMAPITCVLPAPEVAMNVDTFQTQSAIAAVSLVATVIPLPALVVKMHWSNRLDCAAALLSATAAPAVVRVKEQFRAVTARVNDMVPKNWHPSAVTDPVVPV